VVEESAELSSRNGGGRPKSACLKPNGYTAAVAAAALRVSLAKCHSLSLRYWLATFWLAVGSTAMVMGWNGKRRLAPSEAYSIMQHGLKQIGTHKQDQQSPSKHPYSRLSFHPVLTRSISPHSARIQVRLGSPTDLTSLFPIQGLAISSQEHGWNLRAQNILGAC